ncbi:MAG: CoA pyrophosphatase [Clostridiales bacterium]|nr:CoA pyrophosphatase [Clostridiales bacterium]
MLDRILKFKTKPISISECDNYTEFSVLIPILINKNNYELLYEIRSENLKNQPNEICFPGGKIEKGESKEEAAKRETVEELLIDSDDVNIIGPSDIMVTPFNTIVYTYVGIIKNYEYTYNNDEVKEVFTVPLSFFLYNEPQCHYIDVSLAPQNDFPYHLIQKGKDYRWGKGKYPVYFYIYKDKIIWGITARITYDFIKYIR